MERTGSDPGSPLSGFPAGIGVGSHSIFEQPDRPCRTCTYFLLANLASQEICTSFLEVAGLGPAVLGRSGLKPFALRVSPRKISDEAVAVLSYEVTEYHSKIEAFRESAAAEICAVYARGTCARFSAREQGVSGKLKLKTHRPIP